MQTLEINIPLDEWMTSNQRDHRAVRAQKIKKLRDRAKALAGQALADGSLSPATSSVLIVVQAYHRAGRGLDDDNCQPSAKAIKDGLVLAGVLKDDSGKYVHGTYYLPSKKDPSLPIGWHAIRVQLVNQKLEF